MFSCQGLSNTFFSLLCLISTVSTVSVCDPETLSLSALWTAKEESKGGERTERKDRERGQRERGGKREDEGEGGKREDGERGKERGQREGTGEGGRERTERERGERGERETDVRTSTGPTVPSPDLSRTTPVVYP